MIFYNFTPCFEHFNIKLTNVFAFSRSYGFLCASRALACASGKGAEEAEALLSVSFPQTKSLAIVIVIALVLAIEF